MPAPAKTSVLRAAAFGDDYSGLLQALYEVESESERRLAELALAIFLLGQNYQLSPVDYQRLLGFAPHSPELTESQRAFSRVAQEHLRSVGMSCEDSGDSFDAQLLLSLRPWPNRLADWLRSLLPTHWWPLNS
jgi:hypothetical protein